MSRPRPRRDLDRLPPYRSSDTAGGRIFLHANESPCPPPAEVMNQIFEAARKLELNRYPDPEPGALIAELAAYAGVERSSIWVGDGANEVLLQSCLAYGGPGRTALLFEPTYRMHYRQAQMAGTAVEVVRRQPDFSVDVEAALAAIEQLRPDIVFVCTPNNPTGTVTPIDDIRRIAATTDALVVVDEAYFEFCGRTFVPYLPEHPNVVVVRTLSKAFRAAGLRLGYGVADPALLEQLRRVRMPYAQSAFTQLAATILLRHREEMLELVGRIVSERDRVSERLGEIPGAEVFPSGANFVLFRHQRSADIASGLAAAGIIVRDFSYLPGCENCLRVTTGTPADNDEFLEATAAAV